MVRPALAQQCRRRRCRWPWCSVVALLSASADRLDGVVVDGSSGRVAAGATLTFNGRVLRRYSSSAFAFAGSRSSGLPLAAAAPGYAAVELEVGRRQTFVTVALKPVAVPGWSGLVVFPQRRGPELAFETRLQGADGKAMAEVPAVPMTAAIDFLDNDGAIVGSAPLAVAVDWRSREIGIRLTVIVSDAGILAGAGKPGFVVRMTAGEETRSTRRFAVTPGLFSATISP